MSDSKSDPKLWAIVTIIVAIVGCIGVIVAAFIGVTPNLLGLQRTAQQPIVVTVVAPTEVSSSPILEPTSIQNNQRSNAIAYIYNTDRTIAIDYESILTSWGYTVQTISIDQMETTDFSSFGLIVIGPDTLGSGDSSKKWYEWWGTPGSTNILIHLNKPIIGLGDGGYAAFTGLNLRIGGGYGAGASGTNVVQLNSYKTTLEQPNNLSSGDTALYATGFAMNSYREIGLGADSQAQGVVEIGGVTYTAADGSQAKYGLVVLQQDRYLYWGFSASPNLMTQEGQSLFENLVYFLINAP
jgi:hypothetical protein